MKNFQIKLYVLILFSVIAQIIGSSELLSGDMKQVYPFADEYEWMQKDGYLELSKAAPRITWMRLTPDGSQLYAFHQDNTLRVWDVETGMVLWEKMFDYEGLNSYDMNHDFSRAFLGINYNNTAKAMIFNIKDDSVICEFKTNYHFPYVDEPREYISTSFISLLDNHTLMTNLLFYVRSWRAADFGYNLLWDVSNCNIIKEYSPRETDGAQILDYKWSNHFSSIIIRKHFSEYGLSEHTQYRYEGNYLEIADTNLKQIKSINGNFNSFDISKDDKYITAVDDLGVFSIFDTNSYQKIISWAGKTSAQSQSPTALIYTFINKFVVAGNIEQDKSFIKIWDTEFKSVADTFSFPGKLTWKIEMLVDSMRFITASSDGYLRIFSPELLQKNSFKALFGADSTVIPENRYVQFFDLSTGEPDSWQWSFGDGESSDEQNPVHQYKKSGLYTVRLSITKGTLHEVITKTDYIRVQPWLDACFSMEPSEGNAPFEVQFTDLSVGDIKSWKWSFGSAEQNPKITVNDVGSFTVVLTVSDGYFSRSYSMVYYLNSNFPKMNVYDVGFERVFQFESNYLLSFYGANSFNKGYLVDFFSYDLDPEGSIHDKVNQKNCFLYLDSNAKYVWKSSINTTNMPQPIIASTSGNPLLTHFPSVFGINSNGQFTVQSNLYIKQPKNINYALSTDDGGFYITGNSPITENQVQILKIDSARFIVFRDSINYQTNPCIIAYKDGFALFTRNSGSNNINIYIYNELGIFLEKRIIDTLKSTNISCIVKTIDKGYLLTGETELFGTLNGFAAKLNADMNVEWIYKQENQNTIINSALEFDKGYYVLTEDCRDHFNENGVGYNAYFYILSKIGKKIQKFELPGHLGYLNHVFKSSDSGYMFVGMASVNGSSRLYLLKLNSLETDIDHIEETHKFKSSDILIKPNPVNETLIISFDSDSDISADLVIYNSIGRIVEQVNFSDIRLGLNTKSIDLNNLSLAPGVYFIHLKIGNGMKWGKFIVEK